MKTYKNLYPKIYDFDNLHLAYLKARRCKRYRHDVLRFSANLEENLINIQNHLIWKTYRTGRYRFFTVYEPKERLIASLSFRDRVVHHALHNIIEPIFERSMIHDSYACRSEMGVLSGVQRTTRFLRDSTRRWGRVYCLKGDVKKYFPSVHHETLKQIIRKRIACPDTLEMIDRIIDSTGDEVGMPIGNLTSQLFANVYLNELDHFIKEECGVKYYIRYMDDFVVLYDDKRAMKNLLESVDYYLRVALRLRLNDKTQIFPVGPRPIDFLGYRIWPEYRLLRKGNLRRTRRKLKKLARLYAIGQISLVDIQPSIVSWIGHAQHADSWRVRNKILNNLIFTREAVV
jgi:RNA-directed DNA polymerase